jgi:hypothetical protein
MCNNDWCIHIIKINSSKCSLIIGVNTETKYFKYKIVTNLNNVSIGSDIDIYIAYMCINEDKCGCQFFNFDCVILIFVYKIQSVFFMFTL